MISPTLSKNFLPSPLSITWTLPLQVTHQLALVSTFLQLVVTNELWNLFDSDTWFIPLLVIHKLFHLSLARFFLHMTLATSINPWTLPLLVTHELCHFQWLIKFWPHHWQVFWHMFSETFSDIYIHTYIWRLLWVILNSSQTRVWHMFFTTFSDTYSDIHIYLATLVSDIGLVLIGLLASFTRFGQ